MTNAAGVRVRILVAVRRDALDDTLAQGVRPTHRPLLGVRAAQLARPRNRRAIARSLRRIVAEAERMHCVQSVAPIDRAAVRESEGELLALAARLECARPAAAAGLAIAQRIVTDGVASPLYARRPTGALARRARNALERMDG